jgi:hypothetical protein
MFSPSGIKQRFDALTKNEKITAAFLACCVVFCLTCFFPCLAWYLHSSNARAKRERLAEEAQNNPEPIAKVKEQPHKEKPKVEEKPLPIEEPEPELAPQPETPEAQDERIGADANAAKSAAEISVIVCPLLVAFIILMFPFLIAQHRGHPDTLMIGLITFFFGWTCIIWLVALVWSVGYVPPKHLR